MADYIVGLDFGSRSIKLVLVDNTKEPVVIGYDEELLALHRDPYLADEQADEAGDEETGDDSEREETEDQQGDTDSAEETPEAEETDEWEADFSPSASWIRALKNLLSRHEFEKGTEFITFLPDGRAISIHQDVPFAEAAKVESILPNLLEDRLPLDPEDIVYDFKILTDEFDQSGENVSVVGIGRNEDIRRFLERLHEGGVDPAVLGIPELMLRYLAEGAVPAGETAAVVDIGHRFTRVIVLDGGDPVLARSVKMGGEDLTENIARKFDVSKEQAESYKQNRATVVPPDEAKSREEQALSNAIRTALKPLIRDLRRNFQSLYADERIELDTIYVCGGTSKTDRLEEYLTGQFGVRVKPLPIWSAIDFQVIEGDGEPETAMAVACALQPIRDRSEERLLNLRRGEFEYRGGASYLRSQLTKYGAVAAVLLVLFFGTLFAKQYQLNAQKEAMQQAISQQTKKLFGKSVTDPSVVKNIVSGQTSAKRAFVPEMSAYQLYHELYSRVSKEIELELDRIDVDTDRNIVQMSGTTTDPQTVDKLVSDLEQLECLKNISKKPVRVRNENEARFQLEISSGCS